jgi:hypothetical protein
MNTKKSENRILWICLAAALALTAAYFIVAALNRRSAQPEAAATAPTLAENVALPEAGNQAKPDATSDLDQVKVTLSDYYVFKLDGLDFNFVIAKIHVKGNTPINITLDHFKTSEGTTLDSVDSYVAKLEENSLFLGKQNVWFSLISQNSEYDANIFIPVIDKNAASISVAVDFGGNADLGFDLSKKAGSAEMLQYQADDVITDGKSYQMTVSAAYDITGGYMTQTVSGQEQEYLLPSTTKTYAFEVNAVSLWGDEIVIEKAQYVPENSTETFDALDSSINSEKFTNILDRTVDEKDKGYLFFVAYDPEDHPVTYKGVLKLKVKNSDTWIVVNVDLN